MTNALFLEHLNLEVFTEVMKVFRENLIWYASTEMSKNHMNIRK